MDGKNKKSIYKKWWIRGIVAVFLILGFLRVINGNTEGPHVQSEPVNKNQLALPARHYDDSYEYNYRTGYSGSYYYNYDVEGYGYTGYVYGYVDTSEKYGEGYLYDEYGDEFWVETEWTGYGTLEAYDEYGNWYELETY